MVGPRGRAFLVAAPLLWNALPSGALPGSLFNGILKLCEGRAFQVGFELCILLPSHIFKVLVFTIFHMEGMRKLVFIVLLFLSGFFFFYIL